MDSTTVNNYGSQLIELCKSAGIVILNGRVGQDRGIGSYTRIGTTGASVIDYMLATPLTFKSIEKFHIGDKLPESDHMPLLVSIPSVSKKCSTSNYSKHMWERQSKYIWTPNELVKINNIIKDNESKAHLDEVYDSLVDTSDTNSVALALTRYRLLHKRSNGHA